jgi:hypothetical protein
MLLAIPASLLALAAVLAYSAWAETHFVSSHALILRAAQHKSVRPEVAEYLVARESDRLMRQRGEP